MKFFFLFLVLLSTLKSSPTLAKVNNSAVLPVPEDLNEPIREVIRKFKATGAAVSAIKGDLSYSSTFGTYGLTDLRPVNEETLFRMGSLSKFATALGVMKMVELGLVGLDDPLQKHLPWFRVDSHMAYSQQITIRHLLNHTSGLSREMGCVYSDFEGNWLKVEDLKPCVFNRTIHFKPGSALKYSNLGFALLGQVIQANAVGVYPKTRDQNMKAFDRFMVSKIFRPLGMRKTRFNVSQDELKNSITPLGPLLNDALTRPELKKFQSAGFNGPEYYLATTADDLLQLLKVARDIAEGRSNPILTGSLLSSMWKDPLKDFHSNQYYGLGVFGFSDDKGRFLIGHTGGSPGQRCYMMYDTETQIGVAAVVNTHDQAARDIAGILLKALSNSSVGIIPVMDATVGTGLTESVPSELAGTYANWSRVLTIVARQDTSGKLVHDFIGSDRKRKPMTVGSTPDTLILPSELAFTDHNEEPVKFTRTTDSEGKKTVTGLILSGGYIYKKISN